MGRGSHVRPDDLVCRTALPSIGLGGPTAICFRRGPTDLAAYLQVRACAVRRVGRPAKRRRPMCSVHAGGEPHEMASRAYHMVFRNYGFAAIRCRLREL